MRSAVIVLLRGHCWLTCKRPLTQVQDTPGYGDNCSIISNIAEMVAYVERQNLLFLRAEQDTRRAVDMCASCPLRFCCLAAFPALTERSGAGVPVLFTLPCPVVSFSYDVFHTHR